MLPTLNLLCFGCSAARQLVNRRFLLTALQRIYQTCKHIQPTLATGLSCLCSTSEKTSLSSFLIISFIHMCRDQLFNPARTTTGVENAYCTLTAIPFQVQRVEQVVQKTQYQTLAAIPFKVGLNNSSKNFAITNIRKKLSSFRSCVIYNSFHQLTEGKPARPCDQDYPKPRPTYWNFNVYTQKKMHLHVFTPAITTCSFSNTLCFHDSHYSDNYA